MGENTDIHALVILNGEDPLSGLSETELDSYAFILAVDGALDRLLSAGITPHAVTGDLDSASKKTLNTFRKAGGEIVHQPSQDSTDFEKALEYCTAKGFRSVDVTGYQGSRIDHQLAVWDAAIRFADRLSIRFLDPVAESFLITGTGSRTLENKAGHLCSVIPLLPSSGVTLKGFRWLLSNETLTMGQRISCSNEIVDESATVSLKEGALLVVLHRTPGKPQ